MHFCQWLNIPEYNKKISISLCYLLWTSCLVSKNEKSFLDDVENICFWENKLNNLLNMVSCSVLYLRLFFIYKWTSTHSNIHIYAQIELNAKSLWYISLASELSASSIYCALVFLSLIYYSLWFIDTFLCWMNYEYQNVPGQLYQHFHDFMYFSFVSPVSFIIIIKTTWHTEPGKGILL